MEDIPYDNCADCGKLFPDTDSGENDCLVIDDDSDEKVCQPCEMKRYEHRKARVHEGKA